MEWDCGIRHARIAQWLDDELGLSRTDGGWLFERENASCRIALAPLEDRVFGPVSLERTLLSAQGDPSAIEAFERLFILRFASAGG